jgi:hypothetical protein
MLEQARMASTAVSDQGSALANGFGGKGGTALKRDIPSAELFEFATS